MADLFTNGSTVTGTIAYFKSFNEILVADGDSLSPVSMVLTDSGFINLNAELDNRGVTLQAFTGDDSIISAPGNDSIFGNAGNDTIVGNSGDDTLIGGTGDDNLAGGTGNDVFQIDDAGSGNDSFSGGSETDRLMLTSGTAVELSQLVLNTAASVEELDFNFVSLGGTSGDDLFDLSGVQTYLNGRYIGLGDGNDSALGAGVADELDGAGGNDTLTGNGGDDSLTGGAGNDLLNGGAGNDAFLLDQAATGNDSFQGGSETDRVVVTSAGTVEINRLTLDVAASVEQLDFNGVALNGTAGNDVFNLTGVQAYLNGRFIDLADGNDAFLGAAIADEASGGAGNDSLTGNGGDDSLTGGTGNDLLTGGAGNDALTGNDGDDAYVVDSAADVISEAFGEGRDSVTLSGLATYTLGANLEDLTATGSGAAALTGNGLDNDLTGGGGNDTLSGAAGNDTMQGAAGDDTYVVDALGDLILESSGQGTDRVQTALSAYALGDGVETLIGTSAGRQALTGNALANRIEGGTSSDTLDGAGGADTLLGGQGNDLYLVDAAGDRVTELSGAANGSDTVRTALNSYTLTANVETLEGSGTQGQTLKGNDLGNKIVAGTGADVLDGRLGADTMEGGRGDDLYLVDATGDKVKELAGGGSDTVKTGLTSYTLGSDLENLTGTNGAGATLTGNTARNLVSGAGGDDVLNGREGNDTLTGGGGADTFVFKTALGAGNVDLITDFNAAKDGFGLENGGVGMFSGLHAGALDAAAFKVIGPGGSAVDADDRILYNQSTGQLYFDADGSGAGARVLFAVLTNGAVLTAADFDIL